MMMTAVRTNKGSDQSGMTLFAVMAVMAIFAVGLLAVAPTVQQEIQREKEEESIMRGEEIAEAIRQYVEFYRGAKLPNSMDDLLEGLPQGTHNRMILRPSAATDPLSADGHWRLIQADVDSLASFARRVQRFNDGVLPNNPSPTFDRYTLVLQNSLNLDTDEDSTAPDDTFDTVTDNQPFIGVASQSKMRSVISYYGIENHSKWIFTPLFRGTGRQRIGGVQPPRPPTPVR
ncbi:MAG: type II secretion system protein [Acidobacteria bacterium]|nr:type II secretion system protein [Acidobacteriota bacterium]